MEGIWKYLNTQENIVIVKHGFLSDEETSAVCGRTPVWYGAAWENKEAVLNELRKCKTCTRILKEK